MDCERVQDLLSDFLEGSLPDSDREGVAAHLPDCRPCRAAAEGLKDTLALLRGLPAETAPPELVEGVRRRIAAETSRRPLWRRLLLPAHVKIPLEAAAAVVLFLLVYGSLKPQAPATIAPPQAAPVEAPAPPPRAGNAPGPGAEKAAGAPAGRLATARRIPKAAGGAPARRGAASTIAAADPASQAAPVRVAGGARDEVPALREAGAARAPVREPLPAVPAQRVSTAGETIGPDVRRDARAGESAAAGMFAASPVRLARVHPVGRELTIEVEPEGRPGLEERIASAARRAGGAAQPEPAPDEGVHAMRVQVPAASAEEFLAELRTLGTLPPAEALASPAALPPEILVYRVRIRVR